MFVHHLEVDAFSRIQLLRRAELSQFPRVHHNYFVVALESGQSVGDRYHCRCFQLFCDGPLNEFIVAGVDVRSGFVDENDAGAFEEGSANAQKLLFARGETVALNRAAEAAPPFDHSPQIALLQNTPQRSIIVPPQHVQVLPETTLHQDWFLVNDCDSTPKTLHKHFPYLNTIDEDLAFGEFGDAQECVDDGGLARPRPAHNAHLLSCADAHTKAIDYVGQVFPVPDTRIAKLHVSLCYYLRQHFLLRLPFLHIIGIRTLHRQTHELV